MIACPPLSSSPSAVAARVRSRAQQTGLTAADKAKRWDARERAAVDRRRRAQGDDADARRRAARDRHLPAEECGAAKCRSIWVRTPYNFNFWDIQNGVPARHDARSSTRSSAATPTSCRTSADISSPKATTTSSARRSPTATTRSTGCRSSRGRTARSARPAARRPPSGRWASRRRASRRTRR